MKEYFYMFSQGAYSDYCVGGLYKSTGKWSEEWFAQYLKAKMIGQVPEAEEFFLGIETTIEALTGYMIPEKLYVYCTQEEPTSNDLYWKDTRKFSELQMDRERRKKAWLESKGFNQSVTALAIKDGILEEIEYDEIWNG